MNSARALLMIVLLVFSALSVSANAEETVEAHAFRTAEKDWETWGPGWRVGNVVLRLSLRCAVEYIRILDWEWPSRVGCSDTEIDVDTPERVLSWEISVQVDNNKPLTFEEEIGPWRGSTSSSELYHQLKSSSSPKVKAAFVPKAGDYDTSRSSVSSVKTAEIRDFSIVADRYTKHVESLAATKLQRERWWIYLFIALSILGVLATFFIYRVAASWVRHLSQKMKKEVPELIKKTSQSMEDRKVRQIAIEEMVRHSTRHNLSQTSSEEQAMIRRRIQEALNKGDTDTAKALISLLERIDKQ